MKKMLLALATTACFALPAHAASYTDLTLNNSLGAAANIDSYFSLGNNKDIGDIDGNNTSTILPWVSITGKGDGAYDYFSFTSHGGTIIADIDYTYGYPSGFDSVIAIWQVNNDGTYSKLADNDNAHETYAGALGSSDRYDSFIQQDNVDAGKYIIGVARANATALSDGGFGNGYTLAADRQYVLQISVSAVPEPETYAMFLAGLGIMGALVRRRKKP